MTREEAIEIVLGGPVYRECSKCLNPKKTDCAYCGGTKLSVGDEWVEANLLLDTMSVEEAMEVFNNGPMWVRTENGTTVAHHHNWVLSRCVRNSSKNAQS